MKETIIRRNTTLDMIKYIASYFVIFIHVRFYTEIGSVIEAIGRFAVPIFFITSGYFCFQNNTVQIKRKMKNILKLTLFAIILYNFEKSFSFILSKDISGLALYFKSMLEAKTLIKLFILNIPVSTGVIWFLYALFYTYIIQYFVVKRKISDNLIFIISCILIIIHLVFSQFLPHFGFVINRKIFRNFLFMGFPLFSMGIFIKKHEDYLKKIPIMVLLILILVGVSDEIISKLLIGRCELYIGSLMISFALITIAIKYPSFPCDNKIKFLFSTSTYNYIFHMIVYDMLFKVLTIFNADLSSSFWINIIPIIVSVLVTLLSLLYIKALSSLKQSLITHSKKNVSLSD